MLWSRRLGARATDPPQQLSGASCSALRSRAHWCIARIWCSRTNPPATSIRGERARYSTSFRPDPRQPCRGSWSPTRAARQRNCRPCAGTALSTACTTSRASVSVPPRRLFLASLLRRRLASALSLLAIAPRGCARAGGAPDPRRCAGRIRPRHPCGRGKADLQVVGPRDGFDEALFVTLARRPEVAAASLVLRSTPACRGARRACASSVSTSSACCACSPG